MTDFCNVTMCEVMMYSSVLLLFHSHCHLKPSFWSVGLTNTITVPVKVHKDHWKTNCYLWQFYYKPSSWFSLAVLIVLGPLFCFDAIKTSTRSLCFLRVRCRYAAINRVKQRQAGYLRIWVMTVRRSFLLVRFDVVQITGWLLHLGSFTRGGTDRKLQRKTKTTWSWFSSFLFHFLPHNLTFRKRTWQFAIEKWGWL